MKRLLALLSILIAGLATAFSGPGSGLDQSMMDQSVKPSADLYRYMNGAWLRTFEIPSDKSNYGMFSKLADEAEENIRRIIEDAAKAAQREPGSSEQRVGDYYASFMDSAGIERLGITPIAGDLEAVKRIGNATDLGRLAATLGMSGVALPFQPFINVDDKNTTRYILNMYQGGLSLPDRDYYTREDEKFKGIRQKFVDHVAEMFALAGIDRPRERATEVAAVEQTIAEKHWTRVENRDRSRTYNLLAVSDLAARTPSFAWKEFMRTAGLSAVDTVRVYQLSYFTSLEEVFGKYPIETWKSYFMWRVLSRWAPMLPDAYVAKNFQFFGTVLTGTETNRPRWKRGVSAVQAAMGEEVGRIYVTRHFKPEAKQRMVELVENLRAAYAERIKKLDWMGEETRKKALEKLAKFRAKIGYPDTWEDYSSLVVAKNDLVGNARRATELSYRRELEKLGKPIDRDEWFMTPQTVNAYYNPNLNEIVFPAAILQPPFFNLDADNAVNYGAIGAVIGHEMTHGFDDQGRKSDGDGVLTDWWTETDAAEFEKRANLMVVQYNAYSPIDTMRVNGQLTLGENIADLGGLTIACHAYQRSLGGRTSPVIDGFSGNQRFFLGWAQVWARKYRDQELRNRLLTDPHSPSEYRANGTVANMPEFYEAFSVKAGDPLYRAQDVRVKIW